MSTLPAVLRQRVCGRLGCGNILLIGGPAKADEPLNMTIQCHACGWHYTLGISEQGPLPLQPSMASSHRVATPTVQVSKCAGINNKGCNKNAHGSCTRRCCRSCCVGMGGCHGVKGHSETHLSERQWMKARAEEHEALLAETRTALLSSPADPGPSTRTTSALSSSSKASPSTFLVSGLPVTRVTSKNWPTITTQMNETWMRDYDDKTKEKRQVGGNSQIDLEMVQKFRVIWWEKTGTGPVIFTVQECPRWPKWKITNSAATLSRFGDYTLQFYDLDHNVWVESSHSYPHSVQTDSYILFHSTGIECHDFSLHLSTALRKPIHQHSYFSAVRQSLKSKSLKMKGKGRAGDNSDGEVEFVEVPIKIKQETCSETLRPSKRPCLSPLIISSLSIAGSSFSNPITLDSPYCSPRTAASSVNSTFPFFPLSSISSRSATPSPSSSPFGVASPSPTPALGPLDLSSTDPSREPITLIPGKRWPSNMYVKHMVEGFMHMDALKKEGKGNFESRFRQVFEQDPPKRNTYHDQVRRWNCAPRAVASAALAAGITEEGEWSRFSKLARSLPALRG